MVYDHSEISTGGSVPDLKLVNKSPHKVLIVDGEELIGAMADLFEGQKDKLGEYLKAFHLVDFQTGGIFAINGKVVGLECFSHHKTFEKFFRKLIQSYALDAMDWLKENEETSVPVASIRRFMEGINGASRKVFPSLGLGDNITVEGPFVTGAALVYKETVLHFSVFSHDEKVEDNPKVPYQNFPRGGEGLNQIWGFQ